MGILLSDLKEREQFMGDAKAWSASHVVDANAMIALSQLDHSELREQARLLIGKRRSEVAKHIPKTVKYLGPSFVDLFHRHSIRFWPEGHLRHLVDAQCFLDSLPPESVASAEQTLLRTLLCRRLEHRISLALRDGFDESGLARFSLVFRVYGKTVCGTGTIPLPISWCRRLHRRPLFARS